MLFACNAISSQCMAVLTTYIQFTVCWIFAITAWQYITTAVLLIGYMHFGVSRFGRLLRYYRCKQVSATQCATSD